MKTLLGSILMLVSATVWAQERVETQKTEPSKIEAAQPLFIVDGIPTTQYQVNLINPANILKMEVVQKKVAVLLYGAQAANGAVVITTKKFQPKSGNRD